MRKNIFSWLLSISMILLGIKTINQNYLQHVELSDTQANVVGYFLIGFGVYILVNLLFFNKPEN